MDKFRKLGIIEPIVKAIEEMGFKEPSEIQEKSIPLVLGRRDIIGGSATGSGKTLAFGAGIIQHSQRGRGIQALVLTPTRELAEQITRALVSFSKYKPLSFVSVYGGVSINPQIDGLRSADVVIGTPGRILDHMERETIDLSRITTLVIDEADRMLEMGFIEDVMKIIGGCPRQARQTMLYSATIAGLIEKVIEKCMHEPVEVSLDNQVDPSKLVQVYYDIPDNMKFSLLVHLLKKEISGLVMVFCNTQSTTDFVEKNLKANRIDALAIHGGFTQARRSQAMEYFHSMKAHVLVCTDIAARGLDIKHVTHVYNYNAPADEKQYIHRIGRTARAGKEGKVINLVSRSDHDNYDRLLRYTRLDIPKEETPEFERVSIKFLGGRQGHMHGRGGFGHAPSRYGRPQHGFGRPARMENGFSRIGGGSQGERSPGYGRSWSSSQRNSESQRPWQGGGASYPRQRSRWQRGSRHSTWQRQ